MSDTSAAEVSKSKGRSRLSNGRLLANVDGRSTWARLMRDTLSALVVHCGGVKEVSETKRLAARRVAVIEAELVFLEDKFAQLRAVGDEPDATAIDLYARVANQQRRLSEALGWERTARDVTPTLSQFVDGIARPATAADAGESAGGERTFATPEAENRTSESASPISGDGQ